MTTTSLYYILFLQVAILCLSFVIIVKLDWLTNITHTWMCRRLGMKPVESLYYN